jgi:beta-galactosidase
VFWSQTYTDWSQIEPPILTWAASPNPSHILDYYRFSSDSWLDYQQLQFDILKAASGSHNRPFITTNLMGVFPNLDHYKLAAPLDFITWDSYPTGYAERYGSLLYPPGQSCGAAAYDVGDPYVTGFCHDLMRGLKEGAPFWVMEQQAGHINWGEVNPAIRPGTVRLWTWHNLAAGADATVYFRWRAGLFGQEQYHSGLLRHDGALDLGYREVLRMKDEQPVMRSIQGTRVLAEVAILADFNDLWALDLQPHNRLINYWRILFAYYHAFARAGVPTDVVPTHADLGRYRLVVAPCLFLVDETLAARLTEYVKSGGTLLLGARSGFKTRTNLVTDQPLPGLLRELAGVTVETFHSLPPGITYPLADLQSRTFEATIWAEGLAAQSAQPLMSYTGGPLEGQAAVTVNAVGHGRVVYAGLWPNEPVVDSLITWILPRASVLPLALVPEGVLVCRREGFVFLLNFTDVAATARLYVAGASDIFTGQAVEREVTILPRDVRVMRQTTNTSMKGAEQ